MFLLHFSICVERHIFDAFIKFTMSKSKNPLTQLNMMTVTENKVEKEKN